MQLARIQHVFFVLVHGLVCALPAFAWESPYVPDQAGYRDKLVPFFKSYCLECHGEANAEGEFRVDRDLSADLADLVTRGRWNEVVNVLNSHEMPPELEPQPTKSPPWWTGLLNKHRSLKSRDANRQSFFVG